MSSKSDKNTSFFDFFANLQQEQGIQMILIGGLAVGQYGYARHTADIDFLLTKDAFSKRQPHLRAGGYKQQLIPDVFSQFDSSRSNWMDADFRFVDEQTYSKIAHKAKKIR